MAKSSGLNFNLPSVDDLFSTEEERAEARLEKIVNSYLHINRKSICRKSIGAIQSAFSISEKSTAPFT